MRVPLRRARACVLQLVPRVHALLPGASSTFGVHTFLPVALALLCLAPLVVYGTWFAFVTSPCRAVVVASCV